MNPLMNYRINLAGMTSEEKQQVKAELSSGMDYNQVADIVARVTGRTAFVIEFQPRPGRIYRKVKVQPYDEVWTIGKDWQEQGQTWTVVHKAS